MNRTNTREFELKLEQQQQLISRYEDKLRDVVSAYKSLQKEKNALEETVKSLSTDGNKPPQPNESQQEFVDPLQINTFSAEGGGGNDKVGALTKALATITDEKSKMEANFQADKKKINLEKDELKRENLKLKTKEKQLSNDIEQYKQRLRSLQLEREKAESDQQIMLRELQSIVSSERQQKEQLALQLEEAQMTIAIKESQLDRSKQYEKRIKRLTEELKSVEGKLKIAQENAAKPSAIERKLQYELAKAEGEHRLSVVQEQQNAKETEERLKQQVKMSAKQIDGLETRLADLSEMLGDYDRRKQQDLGTVERLKEKNCQLEIENAALAKAVTCVQEKESSSDVRQLKMNKAKINKHDYDDSNRWLEVDHSHCHSKLEELQNEFDLYKRTSHLTARKTNTEKNNDVKDEEMLRHQVRDLKEQVNNLCSDLAENEQRHRATVDSLRSSLDESDSKQKHQLASTKSEWQTKLSWLEQQLQQQRERSFALLEEKENEIELLKVQLGIGHRQRRSSRHDEADQSVQLLGVAVELCKLTASDKKEAQFLHYAQELARKDVEIANLRKAKHRLETSMREIDANNSSTEESLRKQLEDANEETMRLTRNRSREGANLEYLKNVVLSYMLSSSATSRQHMLNAIATVLKFTPAELQSVKTYNSTWW